MKRQELDQLRQKSKEELLQDVSAAQREIVDLRLKKQQQATTNIHQMSLTKKKLAQLLTLVAMKDK